VKKKKLKRQARVYEIRASGLHYDQVADGSRTFVLVRDDRKEGYEIGDLLIVQKYSYRKKVGQSVSRTIKSIQKSGDGLMSGFLILGLEKTIER